MRKECSLIFYLRTNSDVVAISMLSFDVILHQFLVIAIAVSTVATRTTYNYKSEKTTTIDKAMNLTFHHAKVMFFVSGVGNYLKNVPRVWKHQ